MTPRGSESPRHCLPRALAIILFATLATAPSAPAQYLYLDSSGDGIHSAADVLQPAGPTTFDVWIVTDHNRDGTAAVCPTADGALTINSYEFILHAVNGTVTWGAFVNQRPEMTTPITAASDAVDFHVGFGGVTIQPPGAYKLATITVTPATGTPALQFAPSTPLGGTFITAFGSQCSGNDMDNTLKLGLDWFDADGAAYGGVANHPPALAPIADVTVPEGTMTDIGLTATDLDGQPLSFSLLSGPMFVSVTTTDPGTGTATGRARVAPAFTDSGSYAATVSVTDGIGSGSQSFAIRVPNVNRAPVLAQVKDMMPSAGVEMSQILNATDPDGDPVTFLKIAGPMWLAVTTTVPGGGGLPATGMVALTPGSMDTGMFTGTVGVTDGTLSDSKSFTITVRPAGGTLMLKAPMMAMADEGDLLAFNVSAAVMAGVHVTLTAMALPMGSTFVDHGDNTGTFTWVPIFSQAGTYMPMFSGDDGMGGTGTVTVNVTIADVTRAVALAQPLDMEVTEGSLASQTLYGFDANGDPLTFRKVSGPSWLAVSTAMPGMGMGQGLAEAAPGFSDAGTDSATVSVSDGVSHEERSFHVHVIDAGAGPAPGAPPFVAPPMRVATMMTPHTVAMGDLDGDGKLDLVVANLNSSKVSIYPGKGDGTFGMRADYPTMMNPHTVVIRDLNGDGLPDLTVSNMGSNSIGVMLGSHEGMSGMGNIPLRPMRTFPMPGSPMFCGVDDFDGDGIPDVVATDRTTGSLAVFRGKGDGTLQFLQEVATGAGAHGLVVGDVNRDGKLDVVVANPEAGTVTVLLGRGDLSFTRLPDFTTAAPHTVALGDVNGDGNPDLGVANYDAGTVSICMGRGDGTFGPPADLPTGAHAHGSYLADVDGDGLTDLLVANEGASTLSVLMGHGDGTFDARVDFATDAGAHSIAVGDLNGDGAPDVAVSNINANSVNVFLNRRPAILPAHAFTDAGSRMLRLMVPGGAWTVSVEPADGAFRAQDVIPSSLALLSAAGTGQVARIGATMGKQMVVADRDRDGIPDLQVPFSMSDLARLFGLAPGRREVAATIQGDLQDGRRFRGSFPVTLFYAPGLLRRGASVAPNPLNPEAVLSFETALPGRVTVRLYDVTGRLVRTALEEPAMAAGAHTLRIDGRDARGTPLASGVYFFRVSSPDGERTGRFAILK